MVPLKPFIKNSKCECLFSEASSVGDVTESRIAKDKWKFVINGENFGIVNLTETPSKRSLKEIEVGSKKRKRTYGLNKEFQDAWVAKLPWVECVVDDDGLHHPHEVQNLHKGYKER